MLPMHSQIEIYQDMSSLSTQMVEAARANDWDRLVDLERSVANLRATLMAMNDNSGLSIEDTEAKARLIRRVLDDDAEIRRHTEPWMEHVRHFLGSTVKRKEVERAYSTSFIG